MKVVQPTLFYDSKQILCKAQIFLLVATGKAADLCIATLSDHTIMTYRLTIAPRFFLLSCLFLSLTMAGCKKEEAPLPPLPTNSEKILGAWTLSERLEDQSNNGQFVSVLLPCDLDDTWIFETGGLLRGSQSGTTCEPGSPNSWTIDWELQDSETVLYFDFTSGFDKHKIVTLDDHTLVIHRPFDLNDVNGKVYAKITYKR